MPSSLNLRLLNDSRPMDGGRWNWSVWIDGSATDLEQVTQVRYTLHPTFPNPIRVVTDRDSRFKLTTSGWGEFSILAQLTFADGRTETLERWLRLEGSAEAPTNNSRRRPRVFLSASTIDRSFVKHVAAELEKQDVEVLTADNVSEGGPLIESIASAVTSSDVVAIVISRGLANMAQHDVAVARAGQKVIVPVLLGPQVSAPPPLLRDFQAVHVATEEQAPKVADLLAAKAKDAFFA